MSLFLNFPYPCVFRIRRKDRQTKIAGRWQFSNLVIYMIFIAVNIIWLKNYCSVRFLKKVLDGRCLWRETELNRVSCRLILTKNKRFSLTRFNEITPPSSFVFHLILNLFYYSQIAITITAQKEKNHCFIFTYAIFLFINDLKTFLLATLPYFP